MDHGSGLPSNEATGKDQTGIHTCILVCRWPLADYLDDPSEARAVEMFQVVFVHKSGTDDNGENAL